MVPENWHICVNKGITYLLTYTGPSYIGLRLRDFGSVDQWITIPLTALQGLTKNPVDNLFEECRRECTSLFNAGAYLKRQ